MATTKNFSPNWVFSKEVQVKLYHLREKIVSLIWYLLQVVNYFHDHLRKLGHFWSGGVCGGEICFLPISLHL